MRAKTVQTERPILTEKLIQVCERNMVEILKDKHGEDDRCQKVRFIEHYVRQGLINTYNCEVAPEVLGNHLRLTVVMATEQKNVQA
jgi:riboflavin biosynthesis pyrimidine reductase